MLGKIEGKRRGGLGLEKDEMVRQHNGLNGLEFEQTPGDNAREPGMLPSTRSQRNRYNLATKQQ